MSARHHDKATPPTSDQPQEQASVQSGSSQQGGKQKFRNRPGKSQRKAYSEANQGSWAFDPAYDYKQSLPPKGTPRPPMKGRVEVGPFKPGEYPVLFQATTASTPVHEVPIALNWAAHLEGVAHIHYAFSNMANAEAFLAKKFQGRGDAVILEFHRLFRAIGVLLAGQNAVNAVLQHGRAIGAANYMLKPNLDHVRSMRLLSNQVGMFQDDQTGKVITTPALNRQVQRCVRTAHQLHNAPALYPGVEDPLLEVRVRSWLPITNNDESFDIICRRMIAHLLTHHNLNDVIRMTDDLLILGGTPAVGEAAAQPANPPWWPLIPNDARPDFRPFWVVRPHGGPAWHVWVNTLTANALAGVDVPAARAGQYVENDLHFNFDARDNIDSMIDRWAYMTSGIEQFFHCVDKTALAKAGSVAQLAGVVTNNDKITTIMTERPVTETVASLQALFPSKPYFATVHQTERFVHQSATEILSDKRARWIRQDEKG